MDLDQVKVSEKTEANLIARKLARKTKNLLFALLAILIVTAFASNTLGKYLDTQYGFGPIGIVVVMLLSWFVTLLLLTPIYKKFIADKMQEDINALQKATQLESKEKNNH